MSRSGSRSVPRRALVGLLALVAAGCDGSSPTALPPYLCQPCAIDADCGPAGNRCLDVGAGVVACGVDCSASACPAGFLCAGVTGGGRNCIPRDGVCPAPPDAAIPPADAAADAAGQPDVGGPTDAGGADSREVNCEATSPRAVPTVVYALPDADEQPFLEVLEPAQTTVRVLAYQMGYGGIYDTLLAKAGAGVSVRIIFDVGQRDVNQKYYDALQAAGAEVLWSDPQWPYMHAKVIVVDDTAATVSTSNYSHTWLLAERNFVAQVRDPDDLADLTALFDADWQRAAPNLSCTRLVVSPVNARERILAVIDSATSTLLVESMQFADTEVRAHVAERQAAGVAVRVILADPAWITANADGAAFLAAAGVAPRYLTTPDCHVKAIVADEARAYVGSENLSYTSLSRNREVGLVVTEPDAIQVMTSTFEADWVGATPF